MNENPIIYPASFVSPMIRFGGFQFVRGAPEPRLLWVISSRFGEAHLLLWYVCMCFQRKNWQLKPKHGKAELAAN
jgi:hypothetical protein